MDELAKRKEIDSASACGVAWSSMTGDERTRICGLCQRKVYRVEGLPLPEANALIEAGEGGRCTLLFQREDGTMLTHDCRKVPEVSLDRAVGTWAVRLTFTALMLLCGLCAVAWFCSPG